jgi:RHS repeat-associated protein
VYPTGFQTRNYYNDFGYLKEVRRADSGRNDVYWMADSYAVTGQVDGEIYGNGLINDRAYSAKTGRLLAAAVGRGIETAGPYSVQTLHYTRDAVGNVTGRVDSTTGVARTEAFAYDALDRLTSHTVNAGTPVTVTYDAKGNITSKSDVGTYTYGSGRPHAVSAVSGGPLGNQSYAYDANGNMTSGGGRTLTWTSFNQVRSVTKGSYSSTFSFGANRERVKQVSHLGTTIYVGALYEKFTQGSAFEHKHYIYAPTGRVAVHTERSDLTQDLRYFHSDGLGSITAVSNEFGAVVKRFAFDAWGKRIDPGTGNAITGSTAAGFSRGFTDHEQLDDLGLVHMNGRVYDPVLARFLSADPFVDSVLDSQSLNRYSYVSNNPLGYIDPSGYFKLKDMVKIAAVVGIVYFTGGWGGKVVGGWLKASFGVKSALGAAIAKGVGGGLVAGFSSGFAGSLLNGGTLSDAFRAGVIGGLSGAVTGGFLGAIGQTGMNPFERGLSHGLVHGTAAEATGGKFRHGFYAGFAVGATEMKIGDLVDGDASKGIAAAAIVGGTASALGGGKFANGAISGAFSYMFNWLSQRNEVISKRFWYKDEVTPLSEWYVKAGETLAISEFPGLSDMSEGAMDALEIWANSRKAGTLAYTAKVLGKAASVIGAVAEMTDLYQRYDQPVMISRESFVTLKHRGIPFLPGSSRYTTIRIGTETFMSMKSIYMVRDYNFKNLDPIFIKPVGKNVYETRGERGGGA